jgi:mono/diheme cytochrome c family protein
MRKAIALTAAALFLGIGLLASLGAVPASAQGQQVFNDHCALCHGQDGRGNGPASSAFHPRPKDFHSPSFWQGNVKQKITTTIENGYGPMPAISLNPSQIKEVINYMEQAFKPKS